MEVGIESYICSHNNSNLVKLIEETRYIYCNLQPVFQWELQPETQTPVVMIVSAKIKLPASTCRSLLCLCNPAPSGQIDLFIQ